MVATDPQDTPQTIEGFRQRGDIGPLPWAVDSGGGISRAMGVNALETTIIIDREGKIVYRDTSATDRETLRHELDKVL